MSDAPAPAAREPSSPASALSSPTPPLASSVPATAAASPPTSVKMDWTPLGCDERSQEHPSCDPMVVQRLAQRLKACDSVRTLLGVFTTTDAVLKMEKASSDVEDVTEATEEHENGGDIVGYVALLRALRCCPRCIIRFLGFEETDAYIHPPHVLDAVLDLLGSDSNNDNNNNNSDSIHPPTLASPRLVHAPFALPDACQPCPLCLGVLQFVDSDRTVEALKEKLARCTYRDIHSYELQIQMPPSIVIRQQQMWMWLRRVFSSYHQQQGTTEAPAESPAPSSSSSSSSPITVTTTVPPPSQVPQAASSAAATVASLPRSPAAAALFGQNNVDDVINPLKRPLKTLINRTVKRCCDWRPKGKVEFEMRFNFAHKQSETDHAFLDRRYPAISQKPMNKRARRRRGPLHPPPTASSHPSTGNLVSHISKLLSREVTGGEFRAQWERPETPVAPAEFEVSFKHASVYIAGRYNKYKRGLSQSPWEIGGTKVSETSVEELLVAPLLPIFRAKEFKFRSSGREDIDVCMLGNGRPYIFEAIDPHYVPRSIKEYEVIEKELNASTSLVQVSLLQLVPPKGCAEMQAGAAEKQKAYRCVVKVDRVITPDSLRPLRTITDLELVQTTPVRVLHRRAHLERVRTIYRMDAFFIDEHHIILDLVSQAGTYIKEFIHGDRGRTTPSFGSLLNCDAEILQLDVLDVYQDFPKQRPPSGVGSGSSYNVVG
eukprot:TRINITY_DN943_c0_g1_i1.p1 TRINITY_DN943_c0_g1~~TRINITY_DN943_c0_g1_i1.p1  ORF type:complete len:716 (+),score=154.53 TRINITY_DN943_c0_g1_i1:138-2285(+)